MTIIRLARVYDEPSPDDGVRALVDRLWPRGLHREDPRVGHWFKDVAPSAALRRWYGHQPKRHAEFRRRYLAELNQADVDDPSVRAALEELSSLARPGPLTLVTATKQIEGSQLGVLKEVLEGR